MDYDRNKKLNKIFGIVMVYFFTLMGTSIACPKHKPRIIGGVEATPGEFPWIVALVQANQPDNYVGQFCGGSLILSNWVLTAAHCAQGMTPSSVDVVIGAHDLDNSPEAVRLDVAQIIIHPNYNSTTLDFDLALLRLATPVTNQTLPLIDVPNLADPGMVATVMGWGDTNADPMVDFYPTKLRKVQVPIVSNEVANAPQSYNGDVTINMLAAGFAIGGKDSCQGDSGGPLIVTNTTQNGWVQAGIVSWGEGCAAPDKYGIYTRVANFTGWIDGILHAPPPSPSIPTGILGDFNNATIPDLLSQIKISVNLQAGPTWNTSENILNLTSGKYKVVGGGLDFNGDLFPDFVIQNNKKTVSLRLGLGWEELVLKSITEKVVATGDLNQDGKPEIVAQKGKIIAGYAGTNLSRINLPAMSKASYKVVGVADFTGDGTNDLFVQKGKTLFVFNGPDYKISQGFLTNKQLGKVVAVANFDQTNGVDVIGQKGRKINLFKAPGFNPTLLQSLGAGEKIVAPQ